MSWTTRFSAVLLMLLVLLLLLRTLDFIAGSAGWVGVQHQPLPSTRSLLLREPRLHDDRLLIPDQRYLRSTQGLEQKGYRLRTDGQGFILGPPDDGTKRQRLDVLFLGGSTTESLYVDEDRRFPYALSALLTQVDGTAVRTLNGGFSGNHTMHSLLNLLAKGIDNQPRYAVLMHAVNDVILLSKSGTYWHAPLSRQLVQDPAQPQQPTLWADSIGNLLMPAVWSDVRGNFLPASARDEWAAFRDFNYQPEAIARMLEHDFRAALHSFVAIAKIWGIEPVLMTQFNRVYLNDDLVRGLFSSNNQSLTYVDFVALYRLANTIVREVAYAEDVLLIDLEMALDGDPALMYDAVHLNNAGSEVVAEHIARAFAQAFPQDFRLRATAP